MRALCVVAVAGLAGCVVIQPPTLEERPRWQLAPQSQDAIETGCVIGRAFVRKSGKQGIGVSLQLKSRGDCTVGFPSAHLKLDGRMQIPVTPPAPVVLPGRSQLYVWWPIAFDNNAAWNAGRNNAELHLAYDVAGAKGEWVFEMQQR